MVWMLTLEVVLAIRLSALVVFFCRLALFSTGDAEAYPFV